jgi:hypothetical protein
VAEKIPRNAVRIVGCRTEIDAGHVGKLATSADIGKVAAIATADLEEAAGYPVGGSYLHKLIDGVLCAQRSTSR